MQQSLSPMYLATLPKYLPSCINTVNPLTPDRPASFYQISYTKHQESKISSKLSQAQTSQLLNQITEMNKQFSFQQNIHKRQKQKYLEQLLLMNIQVQRVRTIMNEQGQTLQKMKNQWNSLQQIYVLKFEEIKLQLNSQYEAETQQRKIQTTSIIQQVRQLYIQKINILTRQYQNRLKQKQRQLHQLKHQSTTIQIHQIKQQDLQTKLRSYYKLNQNLQHQVSKLKQQLALSHQEYNKHDSQRKSKGNLLKQRNEQLTNINRQMNEQLVKIREQVRKNRQFMQKNVQKSEEEKIIRQEENQKLKYKNHKLEEQIEQLQRQYNKLSQQNNKLEQHIERIQGQLDVFKNRKTQQQINLNTGTQTLATGKKIALHNAMRNQSVNKSHNPNILSNQSISIHNLPIQNAHLYLNNEIQDPHNEMHNKDKMNQIRRQTEQRISYQQSLKRIHDLENKVEQLNTQIERLQESLSQNSQQIEQKNVQIKHLKKSLIEKQNTIKTVYAEKQASNGIKNKNYQNQHTNNEKNLAASQKDLTIAQKQGQIEQLIKQIQAKDKRIIKLERQIEKCLKKQKQLSIKHQQVESTLQNKLDLKENQLLHKQNQINKRDQIIRDKQYQIVAGKQEVQSLKKQVQSQKKQVQSQKKQVQSLRKQVQNLTKQQNRLIQANVINKQKRASKRHKVAEQMLPDPFAEPLFGEDQQKIIGNPLAFQQQAFGQPNNISQKLKDYQQKINSLQKTVESLQFQWGQTQQNQNKIFRQIQSNYTDQIKMLIYKNDQNDKLIIGLNQMMELQSKKK